MAKEFTKDNFDSDVLSGAGATMVDFWAAWCGPCRMLGPVIEEISGENHPGLTVGKVNVDEQPDLASRYGVMSIPTVILFKDGKEVGRSVGVKSKADLLAMVK